jgi:hypothetical protein
MLSERSQMQNLIPFIGNVQNMPGEVVCACNPSYLGGGSKRVESSRPASAKLARLCLKTKINTKGLKWQSA